MIFEKFKIIYKSNFGTCKEKLDILKTELFSVLESHHSNYYKINFIMDDYREIEFKVLTDKINNKGNNANSFYERFNRDYNFENIIFNHMKDNQDLKLLKFMQGYEFFSVRGFCLNESKARKLP